MFVTARHSRVLAFDNVSLIRRWLSDAFCRLSTGSAYPTRMLWTDGDEFWIEAMRPIIINGITADPTRGDLADRFNEA